MKKYKVGDTIYAKGKIKKIDSGDDYLPYRVKFENNNISPWLSEDSILEPPAKVMLPKEVADELERAKKSNFSFIVYEDDNQIVHMSGDKFYTDNPRVEPTITKFKF